MDLALKSAAVMLLALLAALLRGRTSAAWRHLVWCLSVTSLLLLPVLSLALPSWRVTWLPQWTIEQAPLVVTGQTTVAHANHSDPVTAAPPSVVVVPPSTASSAAASEPLPATNMETPTQSRGAWPWLAIGWATGGVLSLIPLAAGLFQLSALHRRSRVMNDLRLLATLGDLRRQLAVCRNVQLRQSAASLPPLTWGALKPVLLLPAEASEWPEDRRRMVLLHELAHVRRWDWLTQLVASFACALYWFNPLVWLAARQMRIERERACEDLVLASGAKASDYAQDLVALATELSHAHVLTLVTVPMARHGGLEDRLRGILDRRRSRAALTTATVCLGAAIAAAAIAPLAMLRAAPPEPAESETEEPRKEPLVKPKPAVEKPAEKIVTIRGKVVDDTTGEPIARLVVQGGQFDPADPRRVTWGYTEDRSEARDGSFRTSIRWDKGRTARVFADGYIPHPLLTSAPPANKDIIEVTIRLKLGPRVRGVVLDHAGKPVKDAAVFAIGSTAVNLVGGHDIDHESQSVQTDVDGRFELSIGEAKSLAVSHTAFDAWPAAIPAKGDITIRLPEPARVDIDLNIDGADKESVIFCQLLTQDKPEFAGLRSRRRVNIANPGKLSLATLPPGEYQLSRNVTNHLGEIDTGAMLDRQFFELKAGEKKSIDFVREKGARIRGRITWPADTKLMGIVVSIQSDKTEKASFDEYAWTTTYASQTAVVDGTFLTERISPGPCLLVARAYTPLTPEQRLPDRAAFSDGRSAPSFHAQVKIEVPAEGELTVSDLALKPIRASE